MGNAKTYEGSCFCGAVQLTVTGEPAAMGYCHCESCRHWSAGPVNGFTLWDPKAVNVTRGEDKLGSYSKTKNSVRRWCTVCGGHVLTEHPLWGVTSRWTILNHLGLRLRILALRQILKKLQMTSPILYS